MEAFSERVPPQNLEAEQSVLGACLIDSDVLPPVRGLLKPEDFYADKHQPIYTAICRLADRKEPVDLLTVQNELRTMGVLDDVGGFTYLTSLTNLIPTTANTEAYARIVADKSTLRTIQRTARLIVDECYRSDNVDTMRATAVQKMHEATVRVSSREMQLGPALLTYAEDVVNTAALGGPPKGLIQVPFRVQDTVMPLARGEVTAVVAQSGVGKTTYEKNLQFGVAKLDGQVVKGYSLEMSRQQILQKYWAMVAEINTMAIRRGTLTPEEIQRTWERITAVMDMQLFFEVRPRMRWADIKVDATAFAARHGKVDLITVDYVQILGDPVPKNGRRDSQLGEIVEDAKELADELNCHVLFLAQQKINKAKPMGDNDDVAESRDIVRAADNTMFLTRPTEFDENATIPLSYRVQSTTHGRKWDWKTRDFECGAIHPKDPSRLLFQNVMLGFQGKQRMGAKAVIPYEFIPETGVVRDLPPPWPWDNPEWRQRDAE